MPFWSLPAVMAASFFKEGRFCAGIIIEKPSSTKQKNDLTKLHI
jgi:hypothetical protein